MAIANESFIDVDYYNSIAGTEIEEESAEYLNLESIINSTISFMEAVCNRPLKARDFSYDPEDETYNEDFAIFDGIAGVTFYFPTYPVNSLTKLIISGVTVNEASDFDDTSGYFLYKKKGKLIYSGGFGYGYNKNVKMIYNAGYVEDTTDYLNLQRIQYDLVYNTMQNDGGVDGGIIAETLGNYKYTKAEPSKLMESLGLPVTILKRLMIYRKVVIS